MNHTFNMNIAYKETAERVLKSLGIKYEYVVGCRFIVSTKTSDLYFRITYQGEAPKDYPFYYNADDDLFIEINVDSYKDSLI